MTDTPPPGNRFDRPQDSAPGSAEPGQTSRLPPIRRHDEYYAEDTSDLTGDPSGRGYPQNPEYSRTPEYPPHPQYAQPAAFDPPPSTMPPTAARYGRPSGAVPSLDDVDDEDEVPRRRGAGFAGVLAIGGLATAAIGLFALPVQQEPGRAEVFFGQLRSGAAYDHVAILTGADSTSLAGGSIATSLWRYGALGIVAGLAALMVLTFAWGPTRRAGGLLLLIGGVGSLVYLGLAAAQTNKYATVLRDARATRIGWGDWKVGFWVGAGGILLTAIGGLIALASPRH